MPEPKRSRPLDRRKATREITINIFNHPLLICISMLSFVFPGREQGVQSSRPGHIHTMHACTVRNSMYDSVHNTYSKNWKPQKGPSVESWYFHHREDPNRTDLCAKDKVTSPEEPGTLFILTPGNETSILSSGRRIVASFFPVFLYIFLFFSAIPSTGWFREESTLGVNYLRFALRKLRVASGSRKYRAIRHYKQKLLSSMCFRSDLPLQSYGSCFWFLLLISRFTGIFLRRYAH